MLNQFAFLSLGGVQGLILIIPLFIILIFELLMFISVIRNKDITGNKKGLWILGMLLIHPFVAIAYYFTDYKKV